MDAEPVAMEGQLYTLIPTSEITDLNQDSIETAGQISEQSWNCLQRTDWMLIYFQLIEKVEVI